MAAQAQTAGLNLKLNLLPVIGNINPVMHDQSNAILVGNPLLNPETHALAHGSLTIEDRQVNGAVRGTTGRTVGFNNNSMTNFETHRFITYFPRDDGNAMSWRTPSALPENIRNGNRTGVVNIDTYMHWLRSNGYCFVGDACARPAKI
jgi:hypothetical protein